MRFEDLTGKKFGNWLVIERADDYVSPKGYKATQWLCECQCKNKTRRILRTLCLKNGDSKSCGCIPRRNPYADNLINRTFGKLTVIERYFGTDIPNKKQSSLWLCKCECGHTKIVIAHDLKSGKVKSCGCLRSNAEYELSGFLDLNRIMYIPQFNFGCRDKAELPYDFGIFDDYFNLKFIIELNGFQHYKLTHYKNAKQKLLYTQYHDYIKKLYCETRNVELLVIPYWYFNSKEDIVCEYLKKYNLISEVMY